MSLISKFTRIMAAGKRQAAKAKSKPLILCEEIGSNSKEEHEPYENFLCHGDNMTFMKTLIEEENLSGKIQLIYIDPPFFSKANYDAVTKAGNDSIKHVAYGDKWENGLSEYLKMLTGRLCLMKELLADDGLIWVHLDWHVVHYAKVIMDEIFGQNNFVNEIVWNYKSGGTGKKHFARKHDTILVYSKSKKYKFFPLKEKSYNRKFRPYRFKGVKEYKDELGWYTMVNMKDVWSIDMVGRTSAERTGYATQKPEQLLSRIVECCTEEGDLCADFFCGSGTLPAVAHKLGRKFIGCDLGSLAIETTISRLEADKAKFRVYEQKKRTSSGFSVRTSVKKKEIVGTGKYLIKISLAGAKEKKLDTLVDCKCRETVENLITEDSLQLVQSWSIDCDSKDKIHRPDAVFTRLKGKLQTTYEYIGTPEDKVSVKAVDIFGNVTYNQVGR